MRKATRLCAMAAGAAALMLALAQNAAAAVVATGGNATNITLDHIIHIFTNSAGGDFVVTSGGDVEVLVVAGGGGGGNCMGGGGGAGGYIYSNAFPVNASTYTVTIGAGGAGAPAGVGPRGTNGSNSVFGSLTAIGGGGGASAYTTGPYPAGSGGSGGGASPTGVKGTNSAPGQGYNGGDKGADYRPAGGGGAGAAGVNGPGHGGVGVTNAIMGPSYCWAGGGGGSGYSTDGGNGGNGGGGGGAIGITTGGSGLNNGSPGGGGAQGSVPAAYKPGGDGGANTGGGGGGGSYYDSNNKGGAGGSGIVVVKYPVDPANPKIDNAAATNVLLYSAFLNGTLVSTGASETVVVSVYWGLADGAKDKNAWAHTNDFTGPFVTGQSLSASIAGLTSNTIYYYRFYASNTASEVWAPLTTNFTTIGPPALNNGGGADQVGGYSARLRGQVTAGSPTPMAYICWGDNDPGVDSTGAWDTVISAGTQSGSFNQTVSGLAHNTQYFYRCYATNVSGETWASEVTNFTTAAATDKVWTGSNSWTSVTNWTPSGQPGAADRALIQSGNCLISASATIASLLVNTNATLTFTNWSTCLTATNVTILTNGNMTCAGPFTNSPAMSNRVYVVCSNLTVQAGGQINVDYKGYAGGFQTTAAPYDGYGPGKGLSPNADYSSGGGYGGRGGRSYLGVQGGQPYGSITNPADPGSGGAGRGAEPGGAGGGAIRIQASGPVTINGSINARGQAGTLNIGSSGSGGGVWIDCYTFAGTNGTILAEGAKSPHGAAGAGGGGRIAINYNPAAQAAMPKPSVRFSTMVFTSLGYANSEVATPSGPDIGTLAFTDNSLLDENWVAHAGQWIVPGLTNLAFSSLNITNAWIRFPAEGLRLTVTNDIRISGGAIITNAVLDLGNTMTTNALTLRGVATNNLPQWDSPPLRYGFLCYTNGPVLNCGGNLILTNSSSLYKSSLYSSHAISNLPGADYGVLLNVSGTVYVGSNSWIYLYSNPTSGVSPLLTAKNMEVANGGGISADYAGFLGGGGLGGGTPTPLMRNGSGPGGGPGYDCSGGQNYCSGGGHGGQGGRSTAQPLVGVTNDSAAAPAFPGSGGGGSGWSPTYPAWGGAGGGVIRVNANGTVTVNGSIQANGYIGGGSFGGGGAGGSVWIRCKTFKGSTGVIRANGGNQYTVSGGGGGGGRIAVWSIINTFTGSASVTNGTSYLTDAAVGTIVWGELPPPGTIIKFR